MKKHLLLLAFAIASGAFLINVGHSRFGGLIPNRPSQPPAQNPSTQTINIQNYIANLDKLKSDQNNGRLTDKMRNNLIDQLKILRSGISSLNDANRCTQSDKNKVRYLNEKLETCNGSQRILIPSKTFEPTEVETDEQGIQLWFDSHLDPKHPNCHPGGFEKIGEGTTRKGGGGKQLERLTKDRRSAVCKRRLPTKTVKIGSKCVKEHWINSIDGDNFNIGFKEGKINKFGQCISSNTNNSLHIPIPHDSGMRDLPQSENSF